MTMVFFFSAMNAFAQDQSIRYVALGDSYTIGTGATPTQAWPSVVVERLRKNGIAIELTANLGVNGWTTQNLIDHELPALAKLKPDVVTVLIGANDFVQGIPAQMFDKNIQFIFDYLAKTFPKTEILVITVPDFSVTPFGKEFSSVRDVSKGLFEFNQIITKEARARNLKVVDLYSFSKKMGVDGTLICPDGLHPSAKEYDRWAQFIEPAFKDIK